MAKRLSERMAEKLSERLSKVADMQEGRETSTSSKMPDLQLGSCLIEHPIIPFGKEHSLLKQCCNDRAQHAPGNYMLPEA